MVEEFEAKAKAMNATSRTIDLLGNGSTGTLTPDDKGDPA